MIDDLIKEFHQKLTFSRLNKSDIYDSKLERLYDGVIKGMSTGFNIYRNSVPSFLASLEENNTTAIPFSIDAFMKLQKLVVQSKNYEPSDLKVLDPDADKDAVEKYRILVERNLSNNNRPRLSEAEIILTTQDTDDQKKMISLIVEKLQLDGERLSWDKNMVEDNILNLFFLRGLLIHLNRVELFYYVVGIFLDRLISSEYFQAARDIAEEINIAAFKDNLPELGFFNSFRIYSNIGSIHASLMYANLSLTCAIKKRKSYPEKYVQDMLWQAIKLFRNTNLTHFGKEVYNSIPKELPFSKYERRALDHTYFAMLISELDLNTPFLILDYINRERESIISGGTHDVLPWLISLYNIRRLYPSIDFDKSEFASYLSIFESIVPFEVIEKHKNIIEGNSSELKTYLKESLIKLNETRNHVDFVYDNEAALKISNRLIEYCVINKDSSGFLLAMLIKSDYSMLFQSKESDELSPLILPETQGNQINLLYDSDQLFFQRISLNNNECVIWLAFSEGKLYELLLNSYTYTYYKLDSWSNSTFKELIDSDYFTDFSFEETIRDKKGNVREIYPEEYAEDEIKILDELKINKIFIKEDVDTLYIVKDMQLAKLPHNLFLDANGKFIYKTKPITNILSTEWFLENKQSMSLEKGYSKSIWIPTESQDFAISYLFSYIEDTLLQNYFTVFQETQLTSPLASDINIVCSHGGENISEDQFFSQKTSKTYNLKEVIGKGKILIFFVCYSGSMKNEFFRNNVSSLIKRYLLQGYNAVIAPFWALDISVPKYWLPEFLKSLDEGKTLDKAVHDGNMKVYDKIPAPAAWACLHLYGNPYLRVH